MKRIQNSFKWAGHGLAYCLRGEKNFRLHCLFAMVVFLLAFLLSVSRLEWMLLIVCICLVLAMEMFNTAVEHLCNIIQPSVDPKVKIIKDVSAGAVLVVALMAAIC